jgi:hypothetical protein
VVLPPNGPRDLLGLRIGDHLLMVNDCEEMEHRRFRQLAELSRRQSYRFILACDRARRGLLRAALEAIDPEDLYYIPLDINLKGLAMRTAGWTCWEAHFPYLKAAGYLDRPVVAFLSHSAPLAEGPNYLERIMQVERVLPLLMKTEAYIAVCSYLESDETTSPIPLSKDLLLPILKCHTHYLGATISDSLRVLLGAGRRG